MYQKSSRALFEVIVLGMSKRYYILTLLALGLLTRFLFFGHPNETVFDEVHFGKFVSAYYTQEFYFDIHPALGKLMIAGFAKIVNFSALGGSAPGGKPFAFAEIGQEFPNEQYKILRFLPNLAGALLPLVIFLLLMEMRAGPVAAFAGGLLIVFENAILTQSHYILMDSFMLLFGFTSLLFYFKARKTLILNTKYLILSGLFSGLALSVKWIALSFIGLPFLFEGLALLNQIKNSGFKSLKISRLGSIIVALILIPITIYFLVFMVDFSVLTKSGAGDAFMSPGFQKTLQGNRYENDETVISSNLFQKFTQLNAEMFKANQRLTATHPYSSQWYTWPLMIRPIYYWVHDNARIYLLGNPIIWWLSTAAILYALLSIALNHRILTTDKTMLFLMTGYVANLLPFIGVKRVMFLYHYFLAYIFAIMILVWLISQQKNSKKIFGVLLAVAAISFIYFSPLSYGLDLSPEAYESRVWLDSWK